LSKALILHHNLAHLTAQATRGVKMACRVLPETAPHGDATRALTNERYQLSEFSELGLAKQILDAIGSDGYATPTPIQSKAIPPIMSGRDLLGIAQTGTGKTAAFALPILNALAKIPARPQPRSCHVLVLTPTRELASQIADNFKRYARFLNLSVLTVFGGVASRPQTKALSRGVDVLIATPGRLLDHLRERNIKLDRTGIFVLDEADQMLDLGFVKPIRQIAAQLPARRQSLFFSATMPDEVAGLAAGLLNDPVRVSVAPVSATAERIDQKVILVEAGQKKTLLVDLLQKSDMGRTLVFTRTKRGADRLASHLTGAGIKAGAIHGNKSQSQREQALSDFKRGKTSVLVATDIAARGIDIDSVSHVVNFELPEVPESYVHRIGRTARAGASGSAISLCDSAEVDLLRGIERLIRIRIPRTDAFGNAVQDQPDAGSRNGSRPARNRRPPAGNHKHRQHRDNSTGAGRADAAPGMRNKKRGDAKPVAGAAAVNRGTPKSVASGRDRGRESDRPDTGGRPADERKSGYAKKKFRRDGREKSANGGAGNRQGNRGVQTRSGGFQGRRSALAASDA
jgi:ATP-dependent RNA helicase RhlE